MARAWFLNLGPPSKVSAEEAAADIDAIWATDPALLVGCEAIAKGRLPPAGKGNAKIRDGSNAGRTNLFAYVRDVKDLGVHPDTFRWSWDDCRQTWPRTEHPGTHPPRSILRFNYKGTQIVVAHKPPAAKGADDARTEHDNRLARRLDPEKNPARPRILLWDCNGLKGAADLADKVRGRVVGNHIDSAIVRRVKVVEYGYRNSVGGHRFHTDHPWGAFFLRWVEVDR